MRVRHADAEVPALFCSYHASVPGSPSEEAPLIVVQITNFRLNELFSCEIIRVDPCGKFALDPRGRELVARVEHLLGARFPTLSQACQTFFKAYTGDPRAKTDYMENFRAYIEPLDPPRFDAKRLASCARNVALHGGVESAFTRFSPDLVETPVIVHPIKPVDRPAPGLWIAVGHGRPYVPWDMPQHEVTREMALLREKVRRSRVIAGPRGPCPHSCQRALALRAGRL